MKDDGVGATEIFKTLKIGRASVYRIINDRKSGRFNEQAGYDTPHPLQQDIDAWTARATYPSQQSSGYGGHVEMSSDLQAVRAFVRQHLATTGHMPKKSKTVVTLRASGIQKEFQVQFPEA